MTEMMKKQRNNNMKLSVVGLGYVGMSLAVELNKYYSNVVGYDLPNVISARNSGILSVDTVSNRDFEKSDILYTDSSDDLIDSDVIFVTVPTDVDDNKNPVLTPLVTSTITICGVIGKSSKPPIICYESTVYPGATEELEESYMSKYGYIRDVHYYIAYSPERINPGDEEHRLNNTTKIISSPSEIALDMLSDIYLNVINTDERESIITTHSIKAAEMAKMYENCQRDVLISLANEFLVNCKDVYNIEFSEVERLSRTRWNFFDMTPGLVGGHCIPVDPYYMINSAAKHKSSCDVLKTARKTNENFVSWLAADITNDIIAKYGTSSAVINIGIFGLAYKANTNDIRNSKALELANSIDKILTAKRIKHTMTYSDPNVDHNALYFKHGIVSQQFKDIVSLDVAIIAVKHDEYIKSIKKYSKILNPNSAMVFDLPGVCNDGKTSDKVQYKRYW